MVLRPLVPCILLALPVAAQAPLQPPSLEAQLDHLFEDWNREDRPGGAAVVVKDGQVIYLKTFGLACLEHPKANTPKTAFDVGSLAQPFTGAAVALLVHQGKLTLDDPIQRHLPSLPPVCAGITVRHLLEHRSGLADFGPALRLTGWSEQDSLGLPQVLRMLAAQAHPLFPPGSRMHVSSLNYALLAEVVRAASGKSFKDFAWEHLFKPLRMTRTLVRDQPREVVDGRAFYYNFHSREGYLRGADGLGVVGSHSLFTSAEDLGKWLVALDVATLPGARVLLAPPQEASSWYGLQAGRDRGLVRLRFQGSWAGLRGAIQLYPERRVAMAVLANWDYSFHNPQQHTDAIAELLLKDAFKPEPPPRVPESLDPARLAALAGEYRMAPGQYFSLKADGTRLQLTSRSNTLSLEPCGPDRWRHAQYGVSVRFLPGPPSACLLEAGGEETRCPRVERSLPAPADLQALVGTYACRELELSLDVVVLNGELAVRHPRLGTLPLRPESKQVYIGSAPFGLLRFARGAGEEAFVVDTDEARHLVFRRR